ncbi:hypothetical protein HG530_013406 [Fusarium avenaceum]|nr:hypothetical protein HG530_013406 [Fusarium avenaceum]
MQRRYAPQSFPFRSKLGLSFRFESSHLSIHLGFLFLVSKLVSVLLDDPETKLLPLNLPRLHPLGLDSVAKTGLLDAVDPVGLALVLKSRPSDTVLRETAETC